MATVRKNFSNQIPPSIIDTEYERCNFSQTTTPLVDGAGGKEGVDIFPGDSTPRTFTRCNMVNVKIHPEWTLIGICNTSINEYEIVDAADQDEVELPGGSLLRTETPHSLHHGRYEQGGTIAYKPSPERENQPRRRRDA